MTSKTGEVDAVIQSFPIGKWLDNVKTSPSFSLLEKEELTAADGKNIKNFLIDNPAYALIAADETFHHKGEKPPIHTYKKLLTRLTLFIKKGALCLWYLEIEGYEAPFLVLDTSRNLVPLIPDSPLRVKLRQPVFDLVYTTPTSFGALQKSSWLHDLNKTFMLLSMLKKRGSLAKHLPKEIITVLVSYCTPPSLINHHFIGAYILDYLRRDEGVFITIDTLKNHMLTQSEKVNVRIRELTTIYADTFQEHVSAHALDYLQREQNKKKYKEIHEA